MLRRLLTTALKLCALAAFVAVVVEVLRRRRSEPEGPVAPAAWPPLDLDGDRSRAATGTSTTEETVATASEVADLEREMEATATALVSEKVIREAGPAPAWVAPEAGSCPASHPVKAKLSSGVFHLPGMMYYERTNPDRCYADAAAAEADGLRQAKR